MDYSVFKRRMEQIRNTTLSRAAPVISIIKATKRPPILGIGWIPQFYKLAQYIETDRLFEFHDTDPYRLLLDEGDAMGKFFQRCSSLRILELAVDHPDAFSWATRNYTPTSDMPLMKLE
ncbi:hypothetical protein BGZ76_007999, partial [Entomortierella beljakovae]